MDIFRCEVLRAGEVCRGNLVKRISLHDGQHVMKCDKCDREIPVRDFEEAIDSNPATMGELWFRKW